MKKISLILEMIILMINISKAQINLQFDNYCSKFQSKKMPIHSKDLRKESLSSQIIRKDLEIYLSKQDDFFYGQVDRDGYAPYQYFAGIKFYRNADIICLLYVAGKYGTQYLLATYNNKGMFIDSLTLGIYYADYMSEIIQDFIIYPDFSIHIYKVDALLEKGTKYNKEENKFNDPIYKAMFSEYTYQLDEKGKITLLEQRNENNIKITISGDSIIRIK
jgi:hypothetical protein